MRILLQPSSGEDARKHFVDTIESGVSLELLKGFLSAVELAKIKELGEETIRVWGIVPSKKGDLKKQWLDLREGDLVLFYADRNFFYAARVHSKCHNPSLAKHLWGLDSDGRTWEQIYFIREGKAIKVPHVPSVLGYLPRHVVQAAQLLDESKSDAMLQHLETHEVDLIEEEKVEPSKEDEREVCERADRIRTPEEADREIAELTAMMMEVPVKERIRKAKALVRNPKFARLVKERVRYVCQICGIKPFIQRSGLPFAEAHHVMELAKSRVDHPKAMICVCPTCHEVIHRGNEQAMADRIGLHTDSVSNP